MNSHPRTILSSRGHMLTMDDYVLARQIHSRVSRVEKRTRTIVLQSHFVTRDS